MNKQVANAPVGAAFTMGAPGPFTDSRDRSLYFPAPGHEAVMEALRDALGSGRPPFLAVVGQPGSGKTYLRTLLHGDLQGSPFACASIESSLLDFDQMLLEIISQVSGRRAQAGDWPDRYARLAELKRILAQQIVRRGRHLVVQIDEAHGLSTETLENLRLLSNISTDQHGILTFVLYGAHALEEQLERQPELAWRVGNPLVIEPMDSDTTEAYVRQRCAQHGQIEVDELCAEDWSALHRVSGGLPGAVNKMMRDALRRAAANGSTLANELTATLEAGSASSPFGWNGAYN